MIVHVTLYSFCLLILQDSAVTDIACDALNGLKMGDKTLTVRRAAVRYVDRELDY